MRKTYTRALRPGGVHSANSKRNSPAGKRLYHHLQHLPEHRGWPSKKKSTASQTFDKYISCNGCTHAVAMHLSRGRRSADSFILRNEPPAGLAIHRSLSRSRFVAAANARLPIDRLCCRVAVVASSSAVSFSRPMHTNNVQTKDAATAQVVRVYSNASAAGRLRRQEPLSDSSSRCPIDMTTLGGRRQI
jgi:hypothetical protein